MFPSLSHKLCSRTSLALFPFLFHLYISLAALKHQTSPLYFFCSHFYRSFSQSAASPSTSYGQCYTVPHASQWHPDTSCDVPSSWWHNQCSAIAWIWGVATSVCGCPSSQTRCCIQWPHWCWGRTTALFQPHWELHVHVGPSHSTTPHHRSLWTQHGHWSPQASHNIPLKAPLREPAGGCQRSYLSLPC